MRLGRRQPEEVAAEIDGYPAAGTRVLERIPAGRVDACRQRSAVKKRPRDAAAEGDGGRIETQHHRVVQQLHGDQSDRGVEWRRWFAEEIGHRQQILDERVATQCAISIARLSRITITLT